jgi:hypothetical protein
LLFLLLLRQLISHRCRVRRGKSWAADARRTTEQRQRPLLSAVFGNISASYDSILIVTTISNPKRFVNLTHAVHASIRIVITLAIVAGF